MKGFSSILLLGISGMALACGSDDGQDTDTPVEVDCDTIDVPSYSEVTAFQVCANCHGSEVTGADRNGAPVGLNFDEYDVASQFSDDIVTQVSAGNMPPPDSGFSLSSAQEEQLFAWAECGTPQ